MKDFFDKTFKIKDLGHLKYFLRLEVARFKDGLHISQRIYTLYILHEDGILASKSAFVPIQKSKEFSKGEGSFLPDPTSYRRLIGQQIYLTNTRPNISFFIQELNQ